MDEIAAYRQQNRPPDRQTSNRTGRYPAARTDICADMPADRQNGSQMLEQMQMNAQPDCRMHCQMHCQTSEQTRLNSKQADLQNRWISRQIDAKPEMQIDIQNR